MGTTIQQLKAEQRREQFSTLLRDMFQLNLTGHGNCRSTGFNAPLRAAEGSRSARPVATA
jgi:hypothetical protein